MKARWVPFDTENMIIIRSTDVAKEHLYALHTGNVQCGTSDLHSLFNILSFC